MQLGLLVVVVFLSSMDLTGSSKVVKGKRQRRSTYETFFFFSAPPDALPFVENGNVWGCAGWAEPPGAQRGLSLPLVLCSSPARRILPVVVPFPVVMAGELQPEVHGKGGF